LSTMIKPVQTISWAMAGFCEMRLLRCIRSIFFPVAKCSSVWISPSRKRSRSLYVYMAMSISRYFSFETNEPKRNANTTSSWLLRTLVIDDNMFDLEFSVLRFISCWLLDFDGWRLVFFVPCSLFCVWCFTPAYPW